MRFRLWSALLTGSAPPAAGGAEPPLDTEAIRVLFVHDDAATTQMTRDLAANGFEVVHERTGESGFFRASTERFDVVVLSQALPVRGGLEVLTALRSQGVTTPVLLLGAPDSVAGRVTALDAGADDCVATPVAAQELHARVRALARRGASGPVQLCAGDVVLDPMARTARRAGRPLQLTVREFQLLEYLVKHQGEVVSRERLFLDLWQGPRAPLENAIDVHIARLRKKVDAESGTRLIHTVRGIGFCFGENGSACETRE